jgi:uncharacterized protein (DUF111 family)
MLSPVQLQEFHNLEQNIQLCQSFLDENKKDSNFLALETMLLEVKKTMVRNTMVNISNVIERIVENGEKAINGMEKQFNVHSIHVGSDDTIYLVSRQILGIDALDKKTILDNEVTYINLNDVTRIF